MPSLPIEEQVAKEFASKYGYLPGQAKQLSAFVKSIHHFSQYIASNKYFSTELNRLIAVLMLDCDILSLKAERVRMVAEDFYSEVELAVLAKRKPLLQKPEVDKFRAELKALNAEALETYSRTLSLMEEIKREYQQRLG
ncbi:hypothetical protein HY995_03910 [Candidatus Micrarchaeota archaeon]|nr:hypothetical protein [Candidatus Micrarchaeota archaeon]MBI5177204.1 hypothetical protein [Candidatus Micrarchaeota archaeon]